MKNSIDLGAWDAELESIIAEAMPNIPEIGALTAELANTLRRNIQSSPIPEAVKSALINQVSHTVLSRMNGVVSVSAMRPSIYGSIGLYPSADLALVYNEDVRIKESAVYYVPGTGIYLPIGKIPGFSHAGGHYLERTASEFMVKHPDCVVTVNK